MRKRAQAARSGACQPPGPEGLRGAGPTWHESAAELMAQVEISRVRLKYLGGGFLALVFMIGTLAGLAGGFLALLAIRLAGGAD